MLKLVLALVLLCPALKSSAQNDDFKAAFDAFKQQAKTEYEDFRSKANAEYAEWLKKAWEEYKTLPAKPKPKDDKVPPVVVKEEDKQKPVDDKPVVVQEEITPPKPQPQPKPFAPIREQPQPAAEKLKFLLYGTTMEVRASDKHKFTLPSLNGESIAKAWEHMATSDYNNLIRDCLELRIRHKLCDWSYMRMLNAMSTALLGRSNEAELLKAFVFCQSGYQMRLAVDGNKLLMLYGSQYLIFDKQCWNIDDTFFYADGETSGRISICKAVYPHEQAMSLAVTEDQTFSAKPSQERTLAADGQDGIKATVAEDENLMAFCNDYPTSYVGGDVMTRWALYANTPMSKMAKDKLYPQLKACLQDKPLAEAVDMLCHWVQTAFEYEYDDKVWGDDRAFFADETLYYPYCDCEDRSILLTRIVRDLLGLKCALVYYPGHLATAVAIGEEVKGDYIRIDGTKYVVCDPTYIGAPIGRTMPGMDNEAAKVIVLH